MKTPKGHAMNEDVMNKEDAQSVDVRNVERALTHLHVLVTSSHNAGWQANRDAWDVIRAALAQPRPVGVPDGWKMIASDVLPPGYTLGSDKNDGSFWPLLDSQYISNTWYATKAEAETAAWRHAHERLSGYMDSVRRYAMLASAPAPAKAGEA